MLLLFILTIISGNFFSYRMHWSNCDEVLFRTIICLLPLAFFAFNTPDFYVHLIPMAAAVAPQVAKTLYLTTFIFAIIYCLRRCKDVKIIIFAAFHSSFKAFSVLESSFFAKPHCGKWDVYDYWIVSVRIFVQQVFLLISILTQVFFDEYASDLFLIHTILLGFYFLSDWAVCGFSHNARRKIFMSMWEIPFSKHHDAIPGTPLFMPPEGIYGYAHVIKQSLVNKYGKFIGSLYFQLMRPRYWFHD